MKNKNSVNKETSLKGRITTIITPLIFIVSFLIIFSTIIFIIQRNVKTAQINNITTLTQNISNEIEFKLDGNLNFLKLLALERANGKLTEQTFHYKVNQYLNDHPEFINITWVDSSFTIKTVSPIKGNSQIIGLSIELPEPKRVSRLAKQNKEPIYTYPFEAIQSKASFEVWVPVFNGNEFLGLFAGIYSCENLLETVLHDEKSNKIFIGLIDSNSTALIEFPKDHNLTAINIQKPLKFLGNGMKVQVGINKTEPLNGLLMGLIAVCFILILSFAYSMWKVNVESQFRKSSQIALEDNERLLQQQNRELILAKEKVEESERKFRNSIENAPYPLMIHAEGDVIQLSGAWTRISGYTIKDIPSIVRWTSKAYGENAIPSQEFIDNLYIIDSVQYDGEWEIKIKNGKKRIWDFSSSPIGTLSDGRKAVISMAVDITDRKIIENKIKNQNNELIISKEKAEESDRLKSAFLANMSHEIRTPMNGILGFSELLKTPNLSGDQQHKYIEIIEKSGNRMLNIINDIVDLSKIEAGLMDVNLNESNINEQIEYIYTFFKPEVEAKGMQLLFKNSLPTKEVTISTDREKVFAILTNLVKNAIKYSNKGSIEIGYVLKTGSDGAEQSKKAELEFFIKDTGIGVPKDRQVAIFERFIQADVMDKMARQGAGLGLSITKSYIEMLGGQIWLESEEGVGSTFYFTLPYTMELEVKNSIKDIEVTYDMVNQVKKLKILIAEDDETSEMLISINVSEYSNEIINARTGIEAIDICRNNPDIDLIMMDIQMPEMNGYEATKQIRKFNKDVVIIAQTAYGLTGDRQKSLDAGCNDYITKPINKSELDSLIQKYFKK